MSGFFVRRRGRGAACAGGGGLVRRGGGGGAGGAADGEEDLPRLDRRKRTEKKTARGSDREVGFVKKKEDYLGKMY